MVLRLQGVQLVYLLTGLGFCKRFRPDNQKIVRKRCTYPFHLASEKDLLDRAVSVGP
jgi:hypothetical protein